MGIVLRCFDRSHNSNRVCVINVSSDAYSLPTIDSTLSIVYAHNVHNHVSINAQPEIPRYVCRYWTVATFISKNSRRVRVVKAAEECQRCLTVEVEDVPRRTEGEERV
jgi:hypothetical protein